MTQDYGELEGWVPLYARTSKQGAATFARLEPGVPKWMRESLWDWFENQLCEVVVSSGRRYFLPSPEAVRELERICRISTGWGGGYSISDRMQGLSTLRTTLYANDLSFLTAVDFYLSKVTEVGDLEALQGILRDAGSEWRVGQFDSVPGLVTRVDDTVQEAAEQIAKQASRPGRLLADAWHNAFSMQRDPSAAYRCAVRAVEAAAGPVITPKDPRPSLGKMIATFRDGMHKWSFTFTVDSAVEPKNVLLQMMQLLWTNEYSRHVDVDLSVPLHVSQEEAESAVVLALTLVNWFTSGSVSPAV